MLFAKDSKLHQITSLKERKMPENNLNFLKLGTLRLSGAPIKSVVNLVPTEVRDLKQHLSVFNS